MIAAGQIHAARALLGIDQRCLAILAGLSPPTTRRMKTSNGLIRGNVDSRTKLVAALNAAVMELIGEDTAGPAGGGGVGKKAAG